jgi:hypothetical protein
MKAIGLVGNRHHRAHARLASQPSREQFMQHPGVTFLNKLTANAEIKPAA